MDLSVTSTRTTRFDPDRNTVSRRAATRQRAQTGHTGADNERLFVPYETMRKDFPMPGNMNTPDSVAAIIAGLPAA